MRYNGPGSRVDRALPVRTSAMNQAPGIRPLLLLAALLGLTAAQIGSCGGDEGGPPGGPGPIIHNGPDTIPPAAVSDLRLRYPSFGSLAVVWTSPGDDGSDGTASRYDIRYSKTMITEENWDNATGVDPGIIPPPKPAGQVETIVVTGLDSGTEYFFGLKAADEVANVSSLSNCPSCFTVHEKIPPADVDDLRARAVDDTSFELTWTAPGDDGMTGRAAAYEIRYAGAPITTEAEWDAASPAASPPDPQPAGETETFVVTGLAPSTSCFFSLKTADELQNQSGISNTAPALAFAWDLWITPKTLEPGTEVYILFRTYTDEDLSVLLFVYSVGLDCELHGVPRDVLASGFFPAGDHVIKYDFFDDSTGDYFPEAFYLVLICRGLDTLYRDIVHFVH